MRGPDWLRWQRRLELENDNLWAALEYAQEAPDPAVASRLGTLGSYFALAERVSEGRRFLERALSASGDDAPVELRVELLANLCFLATEELDLGAALEAGEQALALAASAQSSKQLGLAQLTLALALAQAGEGERADAMGQAAYATLEAAGDDWGAATSGLIRAIGAARAGDIATVAAMARAVRRHSDAIDYDAFRVPGLLLEAWVAERRDDGAAAVDGYRRALELAGRIGFGDHAAFALSALGSSALANGDLREAEELQRQALATADAADATWVAAHVRVQLARVAAATGDADAAERLYRQVLEWSQLQRPHQARESLFVALAGSPATAALLGLAEIAEARGDTAAADELRGRAVLARAESLSWQNPRRAWQSVGIGARRAFLLSMTDEQEARYEHDHDRRPARGSSRPDRPAASARAGRRHRRASANPASPRRPTPGGGVRPGRGQPGSRRGRGEARPAEDEARRRRAFAGGRRLRRLGDLRRVRRGRAAHLGHLPRAAADQRRGEGVEGTRAGRGGDRRRPQPRIAVDERLAQARDADVAASQEARKHIIAARDELEQKAAELSRKFN